MLLLLACLVAPPPEQSAGPDGVARVLSLPPGPGNPRNSEGDFIALKDGRLLFVYTRFTGGTADHAAADLASRSSSDGGRTWTDRDEIVVRNDGGQNVMSVSLRRLGNGEIGLFYLKKNSNDDCRLHLRRSTDEARTWGEPALCMAEPGYYVVNNDRVVRLAGGRWVVPAARHNAPGGKWTSRGVALCYLSDDDGRTWRRGKGEIEGPGKGRSGLQEPLVVELKDGRLMMLCRTDAGFQYRSFSGDGGETWSPAEPSGLASPLSPASLERIPKTGDLLLAWNDHSRIDDARRGKRTPLAVAVSRDEGATWDVPRILEDDPDGWYCYTAIEFAGDRVLLGHCAGDSKVGRLSRTQVTSFTLDWLYRREPQDVLKLFEVPDEFKGDLGGLRPVLKFDDGRPVATPEQWKERREELLRRWHAILGPWPPLLEKPAVDVQFTEKIEGFTRQKVELECAPGRKAPAYLLVPPGKGPFPAIVDVFYYPEDGAGVKADRRQQNDFGYQLVKRGFVALCVGQNPTAPKPNADLYWPSHDKAQLQPLSYLAYVAANAHTALALRADVDAKRIGIVGHSYGGKWALFAGALSEKFAAVCISDPGIVFDEKRSNVNYWEPWYLGYEAGKEPRPRGTLSAEKPRTGPYRKMMEEGWDLHELHALIAPRPFFVSGGSEDGPARWKALNHAVAVNRLLGHDRRVGMSNRPAHKITPEANEQISLFFEHFLKPAK
jgi:dienelactone hydrolase